MPSLFSKDRHVHGGDDGLGSAGNSGGKKEDPPPRIGARDLTKIAKAEQVVPVTALIIDDSPFARKVIRHHLCKLGFKVVGEAETAAQGLKLFKELRPGLVTLDILMPEREGLTSLEAFRAMKREIPDIAVVVVSAVPFEKTRETFLDEGALAYVIKPFSQFSFEPVRQKLQRIFPAPPK